MIGNLTMEQINEFLLQNVYGRIGCNDGSKTYIVPTNYVYDGKHVILHSMMGSKIKMMRNNPSVCFEVDEMLSFTNWKSVIAWGLYQEITGERERQQAMKLFVERMMKIKLSQTALLPDMLTKNIHSVSTGTIRPVIYRIIITEKTGRFEND